MSARIAPLAGDLKTAQKTFWPENLLESNGPEDETDTATDKFAKAFVVLGNNGLTNSNEQFKTYAVIARANYSEFGCVLRWFGRVLHNHVVVLGRCGAR